MDKDDWVVLELNPRSEREDPALVSQSIRRILKGSEVFIPASVTKIGGEKVVKYLMEGYAFIRKTRPDADYLRLEGSKYVQNVLVEPTYRHRKKLATVHDSEIQRMKDQIHTESDQGIGVGDLVKIVSGPYKNIQATVVEDIPEEQVVQIYVQLRSKQSLVTLPRSVLKVIGRSPLSPIRQRLSELLSWVKMARLFFEVKNTLGEPSKKALEKCERIHNWMQKGKFLYAFIAFYNGLLDNRVEVIRETLDKVTRLESWLQEGKLLYAFVSVYYDDRGSRLKEIQNKLGQVMMLGSCIKQAKVIRDDLNRIGDSLVENCNDGVVNNLVVDGHNLAFRCFYAPGMATLSDGKGRPTGIIVGFLRGLTSLKKKFPQAKVYVTWDGSSKRRKASYADYKSNRAVSPDAVCGQMDFLRKLLPLLDIRQAYNPEEEADDVVATLVKGVLKEHDNVVYSTDKDFLQLVTETTRILVPGNGTRKEILYNVGTVNEVMGVPPDRVVELRAFCGDTSDNLPGVPRVPKKVLKSLVKAYGSVDGVYQSGMTGVTRHQYERLRSAEPQVRINKELMTLLSVPLTMVDSDPDKGQAETLLKEYNINPDPFIKAFLAV